MKMDCLLLGLVRLRPRVSGYQLKLIIDNSTGYIGTVHLSRIYPTLKQLADNGWVEFEEVGEEGSRTQKLYTITEAGVHAHNEMLAKPHKFENTRNNFNEYLTRLTIMAPLGSEAVARYLEEGIEHYTAQRDYWVNNNLAVERSYMDLNDKRERDLYLAIWDCEENYFIEELNSRLRFLQELREKVLEL